MAVTTLETKLAEVSYQADGVATSFSVTFPYIAKTHVSVKINGVVDATFTWPSDSTVQPTSTPANGAVVRIERTTPTAARLVDFQDATVLDAATLDLDSNDTFYVAQEVVDELENNLGLTTAGTEWDADSKRISNAAAGTASTDLVTKAQLDAVVVTSGNVPTPGNPADNGKALVASAGSYSWTQLSTASLSETFSAYSLTVLDDADANAAKATLEVTTASTGSMVLPVGTTAQRDATPAEGYLRLNSTTNELEVYESAAWRNVRRDQLSTGSTGSITTPSGTTAQRDGSPANGYLRYNTDNSIFEGYDGSWRELPMRSEVAAEDLSVSTGGVTWAGIPAGTKEISVVFYAVSTTTGVDPQVRLGTGGVIKTTGYESRSTGVNSTGGFVINSDSSGNTINAIMDLKLVSGNNWVSAHSAYDGDATDFTGAGRVTLTGAIDRVNVYTSAAFDNGLVKLYYR